MNDVVERVARAIYETRGFGLPNERAWEDAHATLQITYKLRARAAIEAMREPTEAMRYVGLCEHDRSAKACEPEPSSQAYRAMIDAALSIGDKR